MDSDRVRPWLLRLTETLPVGESVRFLLTGDWHLDSTGCDQRLLLNHLEEASRRGAKIIIGGDLFDAMQGRYDRRRDEEAVRPELRTRSYYDSVVEYGYETLKSYVHLIAGLFLGNHESAVEKHANTDLRERFASMAWSRDRVRIPVMGYRGFVDFSLRYDKSPPGHGTAQKRLFIIHGSGGSAPVTRGAIKTNRRAVVLPDADIVGSGHIHQSLLMPIKRLSVDREGHLVTPEQLHLQWGTYKLDQGTEGWEVEKEFAPPTGDGWWLTFTQTARRQWRVDAERCHGVY